MKILTANPVVMLLLASAVPAQGWYGQKRLSCADTLFADLAPCIATDHAGSPWVVWDRSPGDTSQVWSMWLGDHWSSEKPVSANAPGVHTRFRPSIAFDGLGRAWIAWHNGYSDDSRDIAASYWSGTEWSPEMQVNLPDSTDLDFAPHIACGGGQVWCVWYGGVDDMSPYRVYASRWDDQAGTWDPEMQVSTSDSCYNWWCTVAVDSRGQPHVTWCQYPNYLLYYSFYDGVQWSGPIAVNDTNLVGASPWASPEIAIDDADNLHVSYTGAVRGALHRDVFYTRYSGTEWSPSAKVSQDSLCDEWYSGIAADGPDNVWVVWDRQEGLDQFRVYVSHFDGGRWSAEERLDNDTSYQDGIPQVALDSGGDPWVVWDGVTYEGRSADIFYNRYGTAGIGEVRSLPPNSAGAFVRVLSQPASGARILYRASVRGRLRIEIYDGTGRMLATVVDRVEPAGQHSAWWNGTDDNGRRVHGGIYFCRLSTDCSNAVCKLTLLAD